MTRLPRAVYDGSVRASATSYTAASGIPAHWRGASLSALMAAAEAARDDSRAEAHRTQVRRAE